MARAAAATDAIRPDRKIYAVLIPFDGAGTLNTVVPRHLRTVIAEHHVSGLVLGWPIDPQRSTANDGCRRVMGLVQSLQALQVSTCARIEYERMRRSLHRLWMTECHLVAMLTCAPAAGVSADRPLGRDGHLRRCPRQYSRGQSSDCARAPMEGGYGGRRTAAWILSGGRASAAVTSAPRR